MSLRARVGSLGRRFKLAMSNEPAVMASSDVARIAGINGFMRPTQDVDEQWRRMQIEYDRYSGYRDDWVAIRESQIVEQALWKLAEDSTAEPFSVKCADRCASKEIENLFERIGYFGQTRTEYMARVNGLGDLFLFVDRDFAPYSKRNLAEIVNLRIAPEYTMVRLSDARGMFFNPQRSFVQYPGIDLVNNVNGSQLLAGDHFYGGLGGLASSYGFARTNEERIFFNTEDVIHARLRPSWQPVQTGYGVSAQRSNRRTHNIVMMCVQDLAVARKLATFNRIVHKFDPNASDESIKDYITRTLHVTDETGNPRKTADGRFIKREPGPADQYFIKGGDVTAVDAKNAQLTNIEDLWLHISMVELALGYPLALAGFGAKRFTGEILERMELRLKRTIRVQNQLEEWGILRPLINRQLLYSGKLDAEYEIEFPSISLEDDNKKAKRVLSEVQAGNLSRRTSARILNQMDDEDWDQEMQWMEEEIERIGPPGRYQPPGENLGKGGKGEENEDSATQDIHDYEGTGG